MSRAIAIKLSSGEMQLKEQANFLWGNMILWQINFQKAFENGVVKAKVDHAIAKALSDKIFPAFVDVDYVPVMIKDKNNQEKAGLEVINIEYIRPIGFSEFLNLSKKPIEQVRSETLASIPPAVSAMDSIATAAFGGSSPDAAVAASATPAPETTPATPAPVTSGFFRK